MGPPTLWWYPPPRPVSLRASYTVSLTLASFVRLLGRDFAPFLVARGAVRVSVTSASDAGSLVVPDAFKSRTPTFAVTEQCSSVWSHPDGTITTVSDSSDSVLTFQGLTAVILSGSTSSHESLSDRYIVSMGSPISIWDPWCDTITEFQFVSALSSHDVSRAVITRRPV